MLGWARFHRHQKNEAYLLFLRSVRQWPSGEPPRSGAKLCRDAVRRGVGRRLGQQLAGAVDDRDADRWPADVGALAHRPITGGRRVAHRGRHLPRLRLLRRAAVEPAGRRVRLLLGQLARHRLSGLAQEQKGAPTVSPSIRLNQPERNVAPSPCSLSSSLFLFVQPTNLIASQIQSTFQLLYTRVPTPQN